MTGEAGTKLEAVLLSGAKDVGYCEAAHDGILDCLFHHLGKNTHVNIVTIIRKLM